MINNKKAELTTTHIVILIVLITSFAIILFFIFRLNMAGTTEQQLCRNSVVQRGSALLAGSVSPLNCRTRYLCISAHSRCEHPTMTRFDEVIRVNNKQEFFKVIAEEMATCWWMYGEGEINYVGMGEGISLNKLYCSLCANIVFDKSIKERIFLDGYFHEEEMNNFLVNNYYDERNEITYASYFFKTHIPKGEDISFIDELERGKKISTTTNDSYYLLTGIVVPPSPGAWALIALGTAVVIASAVFTGGGATLLVAGIIGVVVGGAGAVGGALLVTGDTAALTPTMINVKDYEVLECQNVATLS